MPGLPLILGAVSSTWRFFFPFLSFKWNNHRLFINSVEPSEQPSNPDSDDLENLPFYPSKAHLDPFIYHCSGSDYGGGLAVD